ncbi:MAG: thiamine phosphate synthase [Spirochaetaceae bacterium]|jgi:thiamine-phosphate pyrophosphorylase|nr:thiamine phosphate synthase [Spirochaetaceae bacterium]
MNPRLLRLYLCTDRSFLRGRSLAQCVEQAVSGGITMVQLREKTASTREFFGIATEIHALTRRLHVPLVINDRLDVALAVGAEGLHIGQADMPLAIARRLCGQEMIIGVSAGTTEEALEAARGGADYVGASAVFPTGSKDDLSHILGLEGLAAMCSAAALVKMPVVAIGGINTDNVRAVMDSGAAGIAVISSILAEDDIVGATRTLLQRFSPL